MDKEKQIEEMAEIIQYAITDCPLNGDVPDCENCRYNVEICTETQEAEALMNAGYGNVKEALKEFAEKVKMAFYYEFDELIPSIMSDKIDGLIEEVEV